MVVSVRAALALGLTLVAIAVVLVLSGSPVRVLGTSSALMRTRVAFLQGRAGACQGGEVLPHGTSAVRLALEAVVGPSVTVTALSGESVLTHGVRGSGWTGADVTVPLQRVRHTSADATVCLVLGQSRESIAMIGQFGGAPATTSAGVPLSGRMRIEYLAGGGPSWWSQALSVARRLGLGRAPGGTWVALLPALLVAIVAALASYLSIRELGAGARKGERPRRGPPRRLARVARTAGRVPTAAWLCALVAFLNAVSWSILSPPFQTPDEPSHFAYVQQLTEAHRLPVHGGDSFSLEEETALEDLQHDRVAFVPGAQTISSREQARRLEDDLARPLSRRGPGDAGVAATEPPLYYALETIPYELGASGSLLDQLQLMRLLSAFFGGLTALLAFMFVREALPRVPWAWTVGGLGVALAPLFGFMSGAVNPDAMLFTVSAALFYLLARAFRRGLTTKLAAAIGAIVAIGLLTKLNFLGLVPGALLGLIALALRAPSNDRGRAFRALFVALAIAASPALLYVAFVSTSSPGIKLVSGWSSALTRGGSMLNEVSYVWQLYLPRIPGMTDYFPGVFTSRQLWFDGLVGLYGEADTVFPGWVDDAALVPAVLLALLCLRALAASRTALRRRTIELLTYAVMTAGVLALVGVASYNNDVLSGFGPFWEPRYLLPMLPLAGAALALAARGAGRRWGPIAGVLIVVLILGHDVFSQLLVVSRYYG
jgi:hypothetical protein